MSPRHLRFLQVSVYILALKSSQITKLNFTFSVMHFLFLWTSKFTLVLEVFPPVLRFLSCFIIPRRHMKILPCHLRSLQLHTRHDASGTNVHADWTLLVYFACFKSGVTSPTHLLCGFKLIRFPSVPFLRLFTCYVIKSACCILCAFICG